MGEGFPAGVRYTREVGPDGGAALVGARVSLRRRLPGPDAGLGDVLGVVRTWSDGRVVVQRADGTDVEIVEDDVVAVKRIPSPPVRRARR